jgi:hypothetical protein
MTGGFCSRKKFGRQGALVQPLESRVLLSVVPTDVNITRAPQNQSEPAIAINPLSPSHVFEISNIETGDGLMAAVSSDGGVTWSARTIANDSDNLPPACCDPSAAYDSFGNLFLAYLSADDRKVYVLLSIDNGQTFTLLQEFKGSVDQPTVVSGPGSVWLDFDKDPGVAVSGAAVSGLGAVGSFAPLVEVPGSSGGAFGDISVGSQGQLIVGWQRGSGSHAKLYVNVDVDGLGPLKFAKKAFAISGTRVGYFDDIPAQPNRGIDSELALAYDRSGGAFTGRVYAVYTDENPARHGNADIYLRYSDNGGSVWSVPIRINDDLTLNSQFFPRAVVDQTTGQLAISWYDARNDLGNSSGSDTDQLPNDDVQMFAALVTPAANGVQVSANQQISAGASNADDANNEIDLGDYTGLAFTGGVFMPAWADNSNSTGDNPNHALHAEDIYTARVNTSSFAFTGAIDLGGVAGPGPVVAQVLKSSLAGGQAKGSSYTIQITIAGVNAFDPSTLGSENLLVTGPNGYAASPAYMKAKAVHHGAYWLATYKLAAPNKHWSAADDGQYTLSLQSNQIKDVTGAAAAGGVIGGFVVAP